MFCGFDGWSCLNSLNFGFVVGLEYKFFILYWYVVGLSWFYCVINGKKLVICFSIYDGKLYVV